MRKTKFFSVLLNSHSRSLNCLYKPSFSFRTVPEETELNFDLVTLLIGCISFLLSFEWPSLIISNIKNNAKEGFSGTIEMQGFKNKQYFDWTERTR